MHKTHTTQLLGFGITLALWLSSSGATAFAQTTHHSDHRHHGAQTPPASAPASALPTVEAEVRKVDHAAGKITLKHGAIPNLDMPPMTMVFQVSDPALLGTIKAGDTVRFSADKPKGVYTVRSIEALP